MFNNYINRHDFTRLIWGIRHGYLQKIIQRVTKNKLNRAKQYWSKKKSIPSSWWMVPGIQKHTNFLISGDQDTDYYNYVSHKYLAEKRDMVALSLGCGKGQREPIWANLNDFSRIDGYDLSPHQIKIATENAKEKKLDKIISYNAKDIADCNFEENSYDAVFVEQSLHHFSPLDPILKKIRNSLKADGLFIVNEFIGPTRFQWSDRQIEIANAIRTLMPPKYRRHKIDGATKHKVIKPSRFSMIMKDPSEAIESSEIMPLLKSNFEIVECRPYHATLTHILFDNIAHNFVDDENAEPLIKTILQLEKYLVESGEIENDYALIICRKNAD